jgi:hypothetical protein
VGNFLDDIQISLPQPSINIASSTRPNCPTSNNGSILISPSGGTGPYQTQWQAPLNSTDTAVYNLSPGTYTVQVTDTYGCQTTQAIPLPALGNTRTSSVFGSGCGSYTWPLNGQTYTIPGFHFDTISTVLGCDSIVALFLTINQSTSSSIFDTVCYNYTWAANGQTYDSTGTYFDTLTNAVGCDSIVQLNLFMLPSTGPVPALNSFNTGTNGVGGVLLPGSNDLNWTVGVNGINNPYNPAIVMTPPGAYFNSP